MTPKPGNDRDLRTLNVGKEFQIRDAEIRRTREPKDRLCLGTESSRVYDEHVDLVSCGVPGDKQGDGR